MNRTSEDIQAVLEGDRDAFASIVKQYKRLVAQIVFRMIPREVDREDLCQDVFIKVYENLSRFKQSCKMSTWIARITYNTCLNFLEKKRACLYEDHVPEGETIDSRPSDLRSPAQWTSDRQSSIRLCEAIDSLPTNYGLVLSLYHLQDLSYNEISEILAMPAGTVKSYLFRARKMLKDRLATCYGEDGLCA